MGRNNASPDDRPQRSSSAKTLNIDYQANRTYGTPSGISRDEIKRSNPFGDGYDSRSRNRKTRRTLDRVGSFSR
ncbi:MAG: hypothetical protein FWD15_04765 [Alphaproteobacteria bacterium]|nr:hypothetical protein [Alphaproteobacteria bacterium]